MSGPKNIKTIGATEIHLSNTTISSRESYICSNADITRGLTSAPASILECYQRFAGISAYGNAIGVNINNLWYGPTSGVCAANAGLTGNILDTLLGITSEECKNIQNTLGNDWLGCLFGTPMASFSCICPDLGLQYDAFLKFRLNVATFWNTDIRVPPRRSDFLDSLKYSPKITLTIAGDMTIKPGDVIGITVRTLSNYLQITSNSYINELRNFYVLTVKHIITNSGVHETILTVSNINREGPDFDKIK